VVVKTDASQFKSNPLKLYSIQTGPSIAQKL
jgi:hypothetical protein